LIRCAVGAKRSLYASNFWLRLCSEDSVNNVEQ
jgi:hypothetical protein